MKKLLISISIILFIIINIASIKSMIDDGSFDTSKLYLTDILTIILLFLTTIIILINLSKSNHNNITAIIVLVIWQIFADLGGHINTNPNLNEDFAFSLGNNVIIIIALILAIKQLKTLIHCKVCNKKISEKESINDVCLECHKEILRRIESKKH